MHILGRVSAEEILATDESNYQYSSETLLRKIQLISLRLYKSSILDIISYLLKKSH